MRGSRRLRCGCGGSLSCGSLGDKIIMELNDTAKNGDVETAWDSSEVGADAGVEYVPLMRVENSSFPSPQPNTATSNQHNTIEGISTPRDPCGWDHDAFKKFVLFWFATWFVLVIIIGIADGEIFGGGGDGTGFVIMFSVMLFPFGLLIAVLVERSVVMGFTLH